MHRLVVVTLMETDQKARAWLYLNKETGEERVSQIRWNPHAKVWPKHWDEYPLIKGKKV